MSNAVLGSHYAMPMPDAWPGFVQQSELLLADTSLDRAAQVAALLPAAELLNDNDLDRNRYYGLGLGVCELAKLLRNPTTREDVIEGRAKEIEDRHGSYCSALRVAETGLHIGELIIRCRPILTVATTAANNMDSRELLVSDVLGIVEGERKVARQLGYTQDQIVSTRELMNMATPKTTKALDQLFSAASGLTVTALRNLHNKGPFEGDPKTPEGSLLFDPMLGEVVTAEQLRRLDLLQLAGVSASLRLDEFRSLDDFLTVDEHGNTSLEPITIPKDPGPLPKDDAGGLVPIHTDRIGCPALYVNGMIRMVLTMTPEIAIRANQRVARRYGHAQS